MLPESFGLDDSDLEILAPSLAHKDKGKAPSAKKAAAKPPADNGGPAVAATDDDLTAFMSGAGIGFDRAASKRKPWMAHHEFVLIRDVDTLNHVVDEAIKFGKCALDLECTGKDNRINYTPEGKPYTVHQIVGYCLCYDGKTGYYAPVGHRSTEEGINLPREQADAAIRRLCQAAQPVLADDEPDRLSGKKMVQPPRVIIEFWNAKFDQEFLYPVTGIDFWHPDSFHCGYLAAYTLYTDDKALGLKPKAKALLKDPDGNPYEMIELKELFIEGRDIQFHMIDPTEENVLYYACSDAICTALLCRHEAILGKVSDKKFVGTYRLEKQVSQVVRVMERNRFKIDLDKVRNIIDEAQKEKAEYEERIKAMAASKGFPDFNPGSPKQLGEFLFSDKGLDLNPKPPINEKSKQYKTDADTLEKMAEADDAPEILLWIVKWRQIDKILGTYLNSMLHNVDQDGQLRFALKQTGTVTARFSAPAEDPKHGFSGVPIQGIPARKDPKRPKCAHSLRKVFISRPGYTLVKVDYAGQELRIVTNLSQEPVWTKEFLEGTGDLHTITAQAFFGPHITKKNKEERQMGKVANFALIYGGGPAAIMRATKCNKIEGIRRKKAFDAAVPVFAGWVKRQHALVKQRLGIFNAFGRWISIPEANVRTGDTVDGRVYDEALANKVRAACERYSCNFPVQSTGSDILKVSLVLLHREFTQRGWLRNGGDDSVRMLITVHDEIVFEIKHERVGEAMAVITDIMESPSRLLKWRVPLIVEPLLGMSWDGQYDWLAMKDGRKVKPDDKLDDDEYVKDGRAYKKVPPWLEGLLHFGVMATPPAPATPPAAPTTPAAPQVQTPPATAALAPVPTTAASPSAPPGPASVRTPSEPAPGSRRAPSLVMFHLKDVTANTVHLMHIACVRASPRPESDDVGIPLQLWDPTGVHLLIDPKELCVRVVPDKLADVMREMNLGNGHYRTVG